MVTLLTGATVDTFVIWTTLQSDVTSRYVTSHLYIPFYPELIMELFGLKWLTVNYLT